MKKQLHYIDTYFTFRFVSEKLGRRNALIVNSALSVIGCYLQFITKPTKLPEFMFVGRFLLGINLGLGCANVFNGNNANTTLWKSCDDTSGFYTILKTYVIKL